MLSRVFCNIVWFKGTICLGSIVAFKPVNFIYTSVSESDDPDSEKILALLAAEAARKSLGGDRYGWKCLLGSWEGRTPVGAGFRVGILILPLGVLFAFIKAPEIFWPVGVGLWMIVISFMIFPMSGGLEAWGELYNSTHLVMVTLFLVCL